MERNCILHSKIFTLNCIDCQIDLCIDCFIEGVHIPHNIRKKECDDSTSGRNTMNSLVLKKEILEFYFNLLDSKLNLKKEVERMISIRLIELDEYDPRGYYCLSNTLSDQEIIILVDNRSFTRKQLLLECILLDDTYEKAYYNLSLMLSNNLETIEIKMGINNGIEEIIKMNRQQLLIKSIELEPNDDCFWYNLADTLFDNEERIEIRGKLMNRQDIYLKVIEIDPSFPDAFNNLGTTLNSSNEIIKLPDSSIVNRKQLFIKSLDLDPDFLYSYKNLLNLMDQDNENDTIQLLNGTVLNKKQIQFKIKKIQNFDDE